MMIVYFFVHIYMMLTDLPNFSHPIRYDRYLYTIELIYYPSNVRSNHLFTMVGKWWFYRDLVIGFEPPSLQVPSQRNSNIVIIEEKSPPPLSTTQKIS